MAPISQTAVLSAFSWMKLSNFKLIHSVGTNWQWDSIDSDNSLVPARRQAIIWINDGKFADTYMCHSASVRQNTGHELYRFIIALLNIKLDENADSLYWLYLTHNVSKKTLKV